VVSPNQIGAFTTLSAYATQKFDLVGKEINTVPKVKMGGATRAVNPHGLHVNLRAVLGGIFNSAALSGLRRQLVNVAVHPGGSNR
jgi:hypothetical protein